MNRTLGFAAAGIASVAMLAFPPQLLAGSATFLVATKKLVIKDNADPAKYKVKIVIKDPALTLDTLNPHAQSVHMYFYSSERNDWSNGIDMLSTMWTVKKAGFNYKEDQDGIKVIAKLREGKLVFKSTGYPFVFPLLGAPPTGSIAYRFSTGGNNICGLVPGMNGTVKKDDPVKGIFVAVKSEAPAGCPAFED
ncbi:MAG TPA: hypothetical protein VEL28_14840 [Candidatus Binatia bacterium]|nr:hypothetical protein [Candidatus Binatia bacterium]